MEQFQHRREQNGRTRIKRRALLCQHARRSRGAFGAICGALGERAVFTITSYKTMVFATTFHDSGYREFEGNPPINVQKGRPYAHREEVPSFEAIELQAYARNVDWVRSHDPYAGLLVSMHRTGLWQNRYNVFTQPSMRLRERSPNV